MTPGEPRARHTPIRPRAPPPAPHPRTHDRAAREALAEVTRYFENQSHRMDYPSYAATGWAIGSGPVESACKTGIGQRMKGAGLPWGTDGADSASHLRARLKRV